MYEYGRLRERRREVMGNRPRLSSLSDAEYYFRSMGSYLDQLRTLLKDLRRKIK